MICYKDMTFCNAECDNLECHRFYDAGIQADAEQAGLPISLADFSPTCPYHLIRRKKSENDQL